jgi:hypothetical protein
VRSFLLKRVVTIGIYIGVILLLNLGMAFTTGKPEFLQDLRATELQETLNLAAESNFLLSKVAGSGYVGTQSTPVGNVEAAGWTDDIGAYLLVSLVGLMVGDLMTVQTVLLGTIHVLFTLSFILSVVIISRIYKSTFTRAFVYLSSLSVIAYVLFGAPIGITYGRDSRFLNDGLCNILAYCSKVDLFYGLQSAVIYLCFCCILLIGLQVNSISLKATITSTSLVVASGALFRSDVFYGLLMMFVFIVLGCRRITPKRTFFLTLVIALSAGLLKFTLVTLLYFVRFLQTGIGVFEHPQSHPVWHALYLGLSFNLSGVDTASSFGVIFQDNFLYQRILSINPSIVVNSDDYADLARSMFVSEVSQRPLLFAAQIITKFAVVVAVNWVQVVWLSLVLFFLRFIPRTDSVFFPLLRPANIVLFLFTFITSSLGAILVWPNLTYLPGTFAFLELVALVAMYPLLEHLTHASVQTVRRTLKTAFN